MSRKPRARPLFDENGQYLALHDVVETMDSDAGIRRALLSVETRADSMRESPGACDVVIYAQAPGMHASFVLNAVKAERMGMALLSAAARARYVTECMQEQVNAEQGQAGGKQ